jgi:signal transduction histidine kinase
MAAVPKFRIGSLALRLILAAGAWIAVALIVAGLLLSAIFRDYVVRSFDARLTALMDSLVAVVEVGADGELALSRALGEPRFDQAYSGWYWQIVGPQDRALRSRSLWDQPLAVDAGTGTDLLLRDIAGPEEVPLRLAARGLSLPGGAGRYVFAVAGDRREIDLEIRRFNTVLAWSLLVLGAGLLAAIFLQVRYGLSPLRRIRQAIVAVRTGRAQRLEGEFPSEIMPLSGEINTLLEQNAAVVDRARTQVSNLAHALKTPLSVLSNEAAGAPAALPDTVKRQVDVMRRHVDHYLARARAAAAARVLGARVPFAPVADDLRRTLERIHRDKTLRIDVRVSPNLAFRGERQDLEEMLGNLLDNACKWARAHVRLEAAPDGLQIQCTVEDDGPGLHPDQREAVFARGKRLDERVPGSGLGLAIVREIAELYDGSIRLEAAAGGGVRAVLRLPIAPSD